MLIEASRKVLRIELSAPAGAPTLLECLLLVDEDVLGGFEELPERHIRWRRRHLARCCDLSDRTRSYTAIALRLAATPRQAGGRG